ncbi:hypothetical protein PMAYCL1PPCAC_03135, partial [Pristionchus mayeri]
MWGSSFTACYGISLLLIGDRLVVGDNAFVSTLTSESFTLPAKVLGYVLRELHPHIPYVVVVTEEISNETVDELRRHNIDVQRTEKIDTPYLADHKATKFQYTKIRLWSMTSYSSLVHLDLDTLPLRPIDGLFKCGSFCAAIRHSDMMNTGVFVFKPSMEVYNDMVVKSSLQNYSSYDGGDQGFLNTYFPQTKRGPMFIENDTNQNPPCSFPYRPLSASFNYDIGMYYLNGGRALLSPAIIHYTMGPMKPWKWWAYPLFDINSHWLAARDGMEKSFSERRSPDIELVWTLLVAAFFSAVLYKVAHIYVCDRLLAVRGLTGRFEYLLCPVLFVSLSFLIAFHSVSEQTRPLPAWLFAAAVTELSLIFGGLLYASLRRGRRASAVAAAKFLCLSVAAACSIPTGFVLFSSFSARVAWLLVSGNQ